MKKILIWLYYGLPTLLMAWGLFSWIEVVCKNTAPNPEYSAINMIILCLKIVGISLS